MEQNTTALKERFSDYRQLSKKNERRKIFERNRALHMTGPKFNQFPGIPLFEIVRVETIQDLLHLLDKLSEEHFNEEQLILWARRTDIIDQLMHLYRTRVTTLIELRPLVLEIFTLICYHSSQLTHDMIDKGLIVYLVSSIYQNSPEGVVVITWILSILGNLVNDCDDCEKLLLSKNLSGFLTLLIEKNQKTFLEDPVVMSKLIFIIRSIQKVELLGNVDSIVEYFLRSLELSTTMTSSVVKAMVKLLPLYSLRQRNYCERGIISLIEKNFENKKIQRHLLDLERVCLEKQLELPPKLVFSSIKRNINVKQNAAEAQMLLNTVIKIVSHKAIELELLNEKFLKTITKRIFKNYMVEYRQLCLENLSNLAIHIQDAEFLRYFFGNCFNQRLVACVITDIFDKSSIEIKLVFLSALKIFLIFDRTDGHMVDQETRDLILQFVHDLQASPELELYKAAFHFIKDINSTFRPKKLFKLSELSPAY